MVFISHYFFLSLTLMLGTFFNNRAPVIGIPSGNTIPAAEYPWIFAFLAIFSALEPGCAYRRDQPTGDIAQYGNSTAIGSADLAAGCCA